MKKLIVFEEEEFKKKFLDFCEEFKNQSEKGYGVHLVNNEIGDKVESKEGICGALMLVWVKIFR